MIRFSKFLILKIYLSIAHQFKFHNFLCIMNKFVKKNLNNFYNFMHSRSLCQFHTNFNYLVYSLICIQYITHCYWNYCMICNLNLTATLHNNYFNRLTHSQYCIKNMQYLYRKFYIFARSKALSHFGNKKIYLKNNLMCNFHIFKNLSKILSYYIQVSKYRNFIYYKARILLIFHLEKIQKCIYHIWSILQLRDIFRNFIFDNFKNLELLLKVIIIILKDHFF